MTFGRAILATALVTLWALSPHLSELSDHVGFAVLVMLVVAGCLFVAVGFEVTLGLSGVELEHGFEVRLWLVCAGIAAAPLGYMAPAIAPAAA